MPRNIDAAAQGRRKKEAVQSAVTASLWLTGVAVLLLVLRWRYAVGGLGGALMLVFALLELGMLIPIWILLRTRLILKLLKKTELPNYHDIIIM